MSACRDGTDKNKVPPPEASLASAAGFDSDVERQDPPHLPLPPSPSSNLTHGSRPSLSLLCCCCCVLASWYRIRITETATGLLAERGDPSGKTEGLLLMQLGVSGPLFLWRCFYYIFNAPDGKREGIFDAWSGGKYRGNITSRASQRCKRHPDLPCSSLGGFPRQ